MEQKEKIQYSGFDENSKKQHKFWEEALSRSAET